MITRASNIPEPLEIGDWVERNDQSPYASFIPCGQAVVTWIGYRGLSIEITYPHGRKWHVQVDAIKRVADGS